jgi:hypothetical protein
MGATIIPVVRGEKARSVYAQADTAAKVMDLTWEAVKQGIAEKPRARGMNQWLFVISRDKVVEVDMDRFGESREYRRGAQALLKQEDAEFAVQVGGAVAFKADILTAAIIKALDIPPHLFPVEDKLEFILVQVEPRQGAALHRVLFVERDTTGSVTKLIEPDKGGEAVLPLMAFKANIFREEP